MGDVEENELPGVGRCYRFDTEGGERLQVVAYRTGERELLVGVHGDPDAYNVVARLSPEESVQLAELLTATPPD